MVSQHRSTAPAHPRVTYLVKRLELAVRSRLDSVTSPLGLTTPQYAALSSLRAQPGISSAQLARLSFVSAQAMNEMAVILEKKQLIERRSAPDHKKVRRILLTALGQQVLDSCERDVDNVEAQMLGELDADAIDRLTAGLRRCSEALARSV